MKKFLFYLLFAIIAVSAFADNRELNMEFDLSFKEEEPSWVVQEFGFTENEPTGIADFSVSLTPDTDLTLNAENGTGFSLVGKGTTYVYWQIMSPATISAKLTSKIFTLDGGDNSDSETLNWSTSAWKKKEQTADSPNKSVETGEDLSLSKDNEYGTSASADTTVFVHDGLNKALASYGYTKIDITTDDASSKHGGVYKTALVLTITTSGENSASQEGGV